MTPSALVLLSGITARPWLATATCLGGLVLGQACAVERAASSEIAPPDPPRLRAAFAQRVPAQRPGPLELTPCGSSSYHWPLGFTPDGQIVVRGQDIELIDPITLEQTLRIADPGEWAVLARDGRHVWTDRGVIDLESGLFTQQGLPKLPDSQTDAEPVGLSRGGRWLAFRSAGSVALWDIEAQRWHDAQFRDGDQAALSMVTFAGVAAFSEHDRLLAVAFAQRDSGTLADLFVSIFAVDTGDRLTQLSLRDDAGSLPEIRDWPALDFADDDDLLVTLPGLAARMFKLSSSALVWSSPTGVPVRQAGVVDNATVWYAPADGEDGAAVEDTRSGTRLARLDDVMSPPFARSLGFAPEVVTWNPQRDVALIAGKSGVSLVKPFLRDATVTRLFASEGWAGRIAFLGSEVLAEFSSRGLDPILSTIRVPSATVIAEYAPGETQSEWPGALAVSPDGTLIAAAFPENVHVLRTRDLSPVAHFPTAAAALAWSPDGALVATTPDLHYRDAARIAPPPPLHAVEEWELATGQRRASYELSGVPVFVSYAQSGSSLVVGMMDSIAKTDGPPGTGIMTAGTGLMAGTDQGVQIDRATHTVSSYPWMPIAGARGYLASETAIAGPGADTTGLPTAVPLTFVQYGTHPSFSDDGQLVAGVTNRTPENRVSEEGLVLLWSEDGGLLGRAPIGCSTFCTLGVSPLHDWVAVGLLGGGDLTFFCVGERSP